MRQPDREHLLALEESGWEWSDKLQTMVKNEPSSTVVEAFKEVKPYKPAFNDAAVTPIHLDNGVQGKGQEILNKLLAIERTKAVREQKQAQGKIDRQLLNPDEIRAYNNEHGLASNLTKDEQKQLHTIKAAQRKGVEEQQALQREKARRFGDEAAMSNILRIIQNATPTEKVQLKQALEGDAS